MILDHIENYKLYEKISPRIAKGFAYIINNDLSTIPNGTYEIEGMDVFAMVQDYKTKPHSEGKVEGHHNYIDIQYIITGEEYMGFSHKTNQVPIFVNDDEDYKFYDCKTDLIKVSTHMFTIFYPQDLHMPCIEIDKPEYVKKVVVKIKV